MIDSRGTTASPTISGHSPASQHSGPRVSIVICTRNRARLAVDAVESLMAQKTSFPFEIIVVDDGSTDETKTLITELAAGHPGVIRYAYQPPGGLNRARNRGVRESLGEFILLLDDDELAPPDYLDKVLRRITSDPTLDGVGGPYLDNGSGLRTCESCSLSAVDVPGQGVRVVGRLLGGNMCVRAAVFESVGAFHDALSGLGDETEWFLRARSEGKRFLQDPDLWVWHRRDHLSLPKLCITSFRQGLAIPLAKAISGGKYRPVFPRIAYGFWHSIRRRCAKGHWRAFRDIGALAGMVRLVFQRPPAGKQRMQSNWARERLRSHR